MLIKNTNLYINEKNITTIQPYFSNGAYGLCINGVNYEFGRHMNADKALQTACIGKMKAIQTQIIKKVDKSSNIDSIDSFIEKVNKAINK